MPRDGGERIVVLVLRYVAAAAETGDAACFDAAFDAAEAALGARDGALLVARAAALMRALRREEEGTSRFLPPPCRCLSRGEAVLLGMLRSRAASRDPGASGFEDARAAILDLARAILPLTLASSEGRACSQPWFEAPLRYQPDTLQATSRSLSHTSGRANIPPSPKI